MDDGRRAVGWWTRVLDGDQLWGSIDIWPSRYGIRKYRLVVLPPGIGIVERRAVRLARSWPVWGTALWLVLAIALASQGPSWMTVAYPTMIALASGAVAFAAAGAARSDVRTLSVVTIDGYRDADATARYVRLERLVLALTAADAMRARGELSIVHHEAVWWSVYEALDEKDHHHV